MLAKAIVINMTDFSYPRIYGKAELLYSAAEQSAAFTGRRAEKNSASDCKTALDDVTSLLFEQFERGYRFFYTGMATGFDLIAARAVLCLRDQHHLDVSLIGVLPFEGQTSGWNEHWKAEHADVSVLLDCRVVLRKSFSSKAYFYRNKFMVDHSTLLIAQLNAKTGGTAQTIRLARSCGVPIVFAEPACAAETE